MFDADGVCGGHVHSACLKRGACTHGYSRVRGPGWTSGGLWHAGGRV